MDNLHSRGLMESGQLHNSNQPSPSQPPALNGHKPLPGSTIADRAARYRDAGIRILPCFGIIDDADGKPVCACSKGAGCKNPGKHPRFKLEPIDPADVEAHWSKHPDDNIAVHMASNGFVCLDIDPRNGGDLAAVPEEWRNIAAIERTGGGGYHLVFRAVDGVKYPKEWRPGFDIKAGNAFIVVAPSRHISGHRYLGHAGQWLDDYAPGAAPAELEATKPRKATMAAPCAGQADDSHDLKILHEALQFIDADPRESWLKVGMAIKHRFGNDGYDSWTEWSRQSAKFDPIDQKRQWESLGNDRPDAITFASIVAMARENGYIGEVLPASKVKPARASKAAKLGSKARDSILESLQWLKPDDDETIEAVIKALRPYGNEGRDIFNDWASSTANEAKESMWLNANGSMSHDALRSIARKKGMPIDGDAGHDENETYLFTWKKGPDGLEKVAITNFYAWVSEEIRYDDGLDHGAGNGQAIHYRVSGRNADGPLPDYIISTSDYSKLEWWRDAWGTSGRVLQDNRRGMVRQLVEENGSGRRVTVHKYSGWKQHDDYGPIYLHADGANAAWSRHDDVMVNLEGALGRTSLPMPPMDGVSGAIAALMTRDQWLRMINHRGMAIAMAMAPYVAALQSIVHPHMSYFLIGESGSRKSSVANLLHSYFWDIDPSAIDKPPYSWNSTVTGLELVLNKAKDQVVVIDEYVPGATTREESEQRQKLERILRNAANAQARTRSNRNIEQEADRPCRALVVSTGEIGTHNYSLAGRTLAMPFDRRTVNLAALSEMQRMAVDGVLRQAMAGFVQYVAIHYETLSKELPTLHKEYMAIFTQALEGKGLHTQAIGQWATLAVAIQTFHSWTSRLLGVMTMQWNTHEVARNGAVHRMLDDDDATDYFGDALRLGIEAGGKDIRDLGGLFAMQGESQKQQDHVVIFLECLRAALQSGKAHLFASIDQSRPESWHQYGWRLRQQQPEVAGIVESVCDPLGAHIGYIDEKSQELKLFADPTMAACRAVARDLGSNLMEKSALLRLLKSRGVGVVKSTRIPGPNGGVFKWCLVMPAIFMAENPASA